MKETIVRVVAILGLIIAYALYMTQHPNPGDGLILMTIGALVGLCAGINTEKLIKVLRRSNSAEETETIGPKRD